MTSKMWNVVGKLMLALVTTLPMSSCSEFLSGKPAKKETVIVQKESLSCLKEVAQQFKTFLKSESNARSVEQSFTCLDQTLNEFQNRVEGRSDAHSFTADELHEIFDHFIKDAQISREATQDILLLKAAIFGGSDQKITKKEIGDIRKFLLVLKPELKSLIPYAKVFTFKKGEAPFSKNLLKDAFAQLNQSLKNLIKVTNVTRSNYQFEDFKRLISHLKLVDGEQNDMIELASKVKTLLVGNYLLQSEADYFLFIDNLTEVLRLYAVQVQGGIRFEISSSETMNEAIDYLQSWLALLEQSVQFKHKQIISFESLSPLLEELAKQGILPVQLKPATLVEFFKTIAVRVFEAGREADTNRFLGLNQLHFQNIKREVAIYHLYMQFIDSAAPNKETYKLPVLQEKLRTFDPQVHQTVFKSFDKTEQAKIISAFNELKSEFLSDRPVVYFNKKMLIDINQKGWSQGWEDLARAFYAKMLARELIIGWGVIPTTRENPGGAPSKLVAQGFLNEEGLIQWYAEFKDFGIETKAFDPRSVNSGSESFKQADLLTFAGNGNNKMEFAESVQYVNMLVSGGGQTLNEIRTGLTKANCNLKESDIFGFAFNSEACAIRDLKTHFKIYFQNLPWLADWVALMNDAQFQEFYYELMEVTRVDKRFKGIQVETGDLRSMSIILYYIESIFSVYETDWNRHFSDAEIRASYPRFQNFARKYAHDNASAQLKEFNGFLGSIAYSCYTQEDLIRESFIFLVYTGRTPTRADLSMLPCVIGFKKPLIDFAKIKQVDRKGIISTFKILKGVIGSKK